MAQQPEPEILGSPLMVIEENPDDLYLLTCKLRSASVEDPIVDFSDGAHAIAYLEKVIAEQQPVPRLLLTDLNVFGTQGLEVVRWSRARSELKDMRIFVLTGSEHPQHRKEALAAGANEFLVKFPPTEVFARLIKSALTQSLE